MNVHTKDLRREAENIYNEVYHRDIVGCKTKIEDSGTCATWDCGYGEVRACEKSGGSVPDTAPYVQKSEEGMPDMAQYPPDMWWECGCD